MSARLGIGIIGAGVISQTYLENLTSFPDVRVVAVGDLLPERARAKAQEHGVPSWGDGDAVLANPDVDLVVNLTLPATHVEVSLRAVAAGKHVWTEKPLGLDRDSTRDLLRAADAAGVRVGSAPDTILGPGFQTAKRAIADGVIGTPQFVHTAFQTQGPDLWHPEPGFLFAAGAGPLLDMGPYYFSALVSLLGPIAAVSARGSRWRTERRIHTGPRAGESFPVEVPSTVQVLSSFVGGQQGTHLLSFDSALERHGVIEIHGSEGTLVMPDPNAFDGAVSYVKPLGVLRDGATPTQEWIDIERTGSVVGRGLGVLDMARAIAADRPHIATGELGFHVLDVLLSAEESAASGQSVTIESTVADVPLMPADFDPFAVTLG